MFAYGVYNCNKLQGKFLRAVQDSNITKAKTILEGNEDMLLNTINITANNILNNIVTYDRNILLFLFLPAINNLLSQNMLCEDNVQLALSRTMLKDDHDSIIFTKLALSQNNSLTLFCKRSILNNPDNQHLFGQKVDIKENKCQDGTKAIPDELHTKLMR